MRARHLLDGRTRLMESLSLQGVLRHITRSHQHPAGVECVATAPRLHDNAVAVITIPLRCVPTPLLVPNKGRDHRHKTTLVRRRQTSPCQYFPRNNFHHVICATKSNQRRSQSLILGASGPGQCGWSEPECVPLFQVNEMYSWWTSGQMDYAELFTRSSRQVSLRSVGFLCSAIPNTCKGCCVFQAL